MNDPLTIPEAADLLKIHRQAMRRLCTTGEVKSFTLRRGGERQHRLIYPDQLLKFAKDRSFHQDVIKAITKLVGKS